MTPDIKAIKAAAEAATPGPWVEAGPSYGEPKPRFFNSVVTEEDEDGDWLDICCSTSDNTDADMTHIATANPATVIALCDEVERLTTIASELQDLCDMQAKRLAEAEKDAASQFKDVERYWFLRDMDHWPAVFTSSNAPEPTRGNELDECIDKEMESKT